MNKIDLLLVNVPSRLGVYGKLSELSATEPPVWAGLIARYCLNRGFSVKILDAEAEGLSATVTAARIVDEQPRLTVFCIYGHQPSASTQCLPAASLVCSAAKSLANDIVGLSLPTLALGTHPSALPERTLREGPFDYVAQGEGPSSVVGLLESLSESCLVMGLYTKTKFKDYAGRIGIHTMPPAPNTTENLHPFHVAVC